MKWATKAIIIAAFLLAAFVSLACDGPPNADGSCIPPSPCQSAQGSNP